jgi:serine/threonine protein kinase/WD40 repeat protein
MIAGRESAMDEASIFLAALDKNSPEERAVYLDEACGADGALRGNVEMLLKAHVKAGDFLAQVPTTVAGGADTPAAERPGTLIGPYKLLEQIGEGGFGIVFMAEQQQPVRRKVAVKVLKPGMDTMQVVARFEAERQALALMDHANIARVFDGGETATGRPYFVMELVRGVPITDYCDQGRLGVRARLELFQSVCHAVQHAHQKGIIHRDLKPTNVLVTLHDGVGVPKVIDFGIAKATSQRLTEKTLFTNFAQLIGTPLYMSPEQAEMSGLDVDTRSDIYSLGVLLYELLSGTTPFDRERLRSAGFDEIRRIIREEEPARPSARLSTAGAAAATVAANRGSDAHRLGQLCRGELDWIVMKCLEKDRNRRYDTAGALAHDIERYLRDEPVHACPPSAAYRFRKFARRHRVALATGTLVAAILVLGTVVSVWLAARAIDAEGLAARRLETETEARRTADIERDSAKRRLFDARMAQAKAGRLSRQVGQRFDSLAALREATQLAGELHLGEKAMRELRNEAIACLALADARLVQPEWPGYPPGSRGTPGFDADLERYARSDVEGTISIRRVADDHELARLPSRGAGGAANIVFSPDGRLLAVAYWRQIPGSSTSFCIWDWQRNAVVFQPTFPGGSVAFSPDGRHFALAQPDGTVTLHDSAGGDEVGRWNGGLGRPGLAFHPDGRQLAIASKHSRKVQIHNAATGKLLLGIKAEGDLAGAIAWHPAGTLIAIGGRRGQVYLWDAATGRAHAVLQGHDTGVTSLAFAAGGAALLSSSLDGSTRLWDPWAGEALLRLPGDVRTVSRDGRRLLIQTETHLGHWELVCSQEYRTLPRCKSADGEDIGNPSFSPDGRWLLGSARRGVWIWDMVAEGPGVLLPLGRTIDAQFHPKRNELFTSGDAGLYRWEVRTVDGALRIGPGARCLAGDPVQRISMDSKGRHLTVVAQRLGGGARVFDLENPGGKVIMLPHDNSIATATSPDGQWIATGTWHGLGVKLWEARTGKECHHLVRDETVATVTISPDSRLVVTGTLSGLDAWDVASGKRVRAIGRTPGRNVANAAFSTDGTLLAVPSTPFEVQLTDPATWRPVARLLGPDTSLVQIERSAFSPDGSQLVVSTTACILRVWDLRRLREQLHELRLDWDLPAYPPPHAGAKRMRVEVDVTEFQRHLQAQDHVRRGYGHVQARRWSKAAAEYSAALELRPDYAAAANSLAWLLATCPEKDLLDAPRAVALAQQAVRLEPQTVAYSNAASAYSTKLGTYWNTLGVAQYRAANWQDAIAGLNKAEGLASGKYFAWNAFFLAMAHWHLGEREQARKEYGQAVLWMDKNHPQNEELRRFRAEAALVLGVQQKKQ